MVLDHIFGLSVLAMAPLIFRLLFAGPGYCHGLIGDKPKVTVFPVRLRFDIVDDNC
jgi:hypothetical protein